RAAEAALEQFAQWLSERLERMSTETAVGRDAYVGFLNDVALVTLTPEQIVAGPQQELERAIAFEAMEAVRNARVPPQLLPDSVEEQVAREAEGEVMLRTFCEERDLLSFPDWLRRYVYLPTPDYLAPLRGLGVFDDLTSPTRLDQDGVHY